MESLLDTNYTFRWSKTSESGEETIVNIHLGQLPEEADDLISMFFDVGIDLKIVYATMVCLFLLNLCACSRALVAPFF